MVWERSRATSWHVIEGVLQVMVALLSELFAPVVCVGSTCSTLFVMHQWLKTTGMAGRGILSSAAPARAASCYWLVPWFCTFSCLYVKYLLNCWCSYTDISWILFLCAGFKGPVGCIDFTVLPNRLDSSKIFSHRFSLYDSGLLQQCIQWLLWSVSGL